MKYLRFIIILIIPSLPAIANAQKLSSPGAERNWTISKIESGSEADRISKIRFPYGHYNLQVSANEQIVPGHIGRREWAVIRINSELNLQTGKLDKYVALDELNTGAASAIESAASIWFEKSFLVEMMKGKLMSAKLTSTTIKVTP